MVLNVTSEGERMSERISFQDQVVVVTGSGRGLGRSYATELARRGGAVVINDVAEEFASEAVAEIEAAGGRAAMSLESVSTPEGAQALVDFAVERFGTVDAVINNAGFMRNGYLEDLTAQGLRDLLDVHIGGSFFVTRAAWPLMRAKGYGRVVMTSSAGGMFAMQGESNYAAAKGGVYGLSRALASEGAEHGILVNTVMPMASTTIASDDPVPGHAERYPEGAGEVLRPRRLTSSVAPLVAYLCSRDCTLSGETFSAGFGRYARVFVGEVPGWSADDPATVEIEDVAEHLEEIRDLDGFAIPRDIYDEVRLIVASLTAKVAP
jgi:NAD(P)-dependent dehydrogenase (short-subunit alcohol dehydrogenase family)